MLEKKHFVLASVIIYVVLIGIFVYSKDRNGEKEAENARCEDYNNVCLNFCCKDEKCDQSYIDKNFNFSSFKASKTHSVVDRKVVAEFRKPKCTMKHVTEHDWSFSYVSLCQGMCYGE
jgi:hypothetical protein